MTRLIFFYILPTSLLIRCIDPVINGMINVGSGTSRFENQSAPSRTISGLYSTASVTKGVYIQVSDTMGRIHSRVRH